MIACEKQLSSGIFSGLKLCIWRKLIKDLETYFPYKEQRNDHLYKIIMSIRLLGREIGKRWVDQRIINEPNDIFFLTTEEILNSGMKNTPLFLLRDFIEKRKIIYNNSLNSIELSDINISDDYYGLLQSENVELFGDGCSPGVKIGIAKIVKGMSELHKIKEQEILICTSFRPAMSTILTRIGGLIVERGSVLSHGAILSREYGVPSVFNVEGITSSVKNGDFVGIDGVSGIVTVYSNNNKTLFKSYSTIPPDRLNY